jgi:hypothetical protein
MVAFCREAKRDINKSSREVGAQMSFVGHPGIRNYSTGKPSLTLQAVNAPLGRPATVLFDFLDSLGRRVSITATQLAYRINPYRSAVAQRERPFSRVATLD